MNNFVAIRNGGATDEQGAQRFWRQISPNGQGPLNSSSLQVTPHSTPNNSVDIQTGDLAIAYQNYLYHGWSDAINTITIGNNSSGNPRIDSIVAYVDLSVVSSSSNDNPGALKYIAVQGTPGASPSAPSGSTIQTAVGAGNPYYVLGNVNVPNGFTNTSQITNSGSTIIQDMRSTFIVGTSTKLLFFSPGVQAINNDVSIDIPGMSQSQTFTTISAYAKVAPVGSALTFNVYNQTQSKIIGTISLPAGSQSAITTSFSNASVNAGDILRLDCTAIGSTTPGSNVSVFMY